jgi:hypothetical protein
MISTHRPVPDELASQFYTFLDADELRLPAELEADFKAFQKEWEKLPPDEYLKPGSSFRYRRFCYFYFLPATEELLLQPYRPFYQPPEDNSLFGGIYRAFAPMESSSIENRFMRELLKFSFRQMPESIVAGKLQDAWEAEVHMVRVIASADELGEPSPEGIHRDGGESGYVYLMNRQNATGAVSSVYDNDRQKLAEKALINPMDGMMFLDPQVLHNVTALKPVDPERKAVRDVFLFGFFHKPDLERPLDL